MNIKIVDTTLRDGEQRPGLALNLKEKVEIARQMDLAGIYQIEAGIPAMGGEEKESVKAIVKSSNSAKISAWCRMHFEDIKHAIDCGVDIIHISVPSSDLQINKKLNKSREWVLDHMVECILLASKNGFPVTIGLEDASRADLIFLINLISHAKDYGVDRVRYADTVGILFPAKIRKVLSSLKSHTAIEMHAHNDFGMAVSNSIVAALEGSEYIDCTFGGIGERSGNCNFIHFIKAFIQIFQHNPLSIPFKYLLDIEEKVLSIIYENTSVRIS